MIAVDTSTLVAFNAGESGADIDRLSEALQAGILVLPPVVLSEMLSDPKLPTAIETQLLRLQILDLSPGYWQRVGQIRRFFLKLGRKARLADAQIAQSCIDAHIGLISRDKDFKKYADHFDLKLFLAA